MAQIIESPDTIATAFGRGLHRGIGSLLESKIAQLAERNKAATQQNNTASALRAMDPSLGEQQSLQLARGPESLLNQHFKNQQSQRLGEREAETVRAWQQANLPQRSQVNELTQNNPELNAQQNAQQTPESIADQQTRQAISGQSQAPQFPGYITPGSGPQHIGIQQKDLARQEQERQNKIKNDLAQQNVDIKKDRTSLMKAKEEREFSEPIIEKAKASEHEIRDLDSMIKIAKNNNLRAGATHQFLSKFGVEDFGQNLETQIVAKLSAQLARNAPSTFGSQITNFKEQIYQRGNPTLFNSPEGIIELAEMNKIAAQENILVNEARAKLLKDSNGFVPAGANDIIQEKIAPQKEKLQEKLDKIIDDILVREKNLSNNSQKSRSAKIFEGLPDPAQYKNQIIRNPETGEIKKSNGSDWITQ